jgi:hypothetical protein
MNALRVLGVINAIDRTNTFETKFVNKIAYMNMAAWGTRGTIRCSQQLSLNKLTCDPTNNSTHKFLHIIVPYSTQEKFIIGLSSTLRILCCFQNISKNEQN